jgi:hypothetical protein
VAAFATWLAMAALVSEKWPFSPAMAAMAVFFILLTPSLNGVWSGRPLFYVFLLMKNMTDETTFVCHKCCYCHYMTLSFCVHRLLSNSKA